MSKHDRRPQQQFSPPKPPVAVMPPAAPAPMAVAAPVDDDLDAPIVDEKPAAALTESKPLRPSLQVFSILFEQLEEDPEMAALLERELTGARERFEFQRRNLERQRKGIPAAQRFKVLKTKRVSIGGVPQDVKAGTIYSSVAHGMAEIERLQRAGVQFERIAD